MLDALNIMSHLQLKTLWDRYCPHALFKTVSLGLRKVVMDTQLGTLPATELTLPMQKLRIKKEVICSW